MRPTIKIGRDKSNDIEINEPRVSRNHAIITYLGDDKYEIKDLGSTNGTFVNGKRISIQIMSPDDRVEVAGALVIWISAFTNPKIQSKPSPIEEEPFGRVSKTITVGSSPENDLVLNSEFVSENHAIISLLKNGDYFIKELGSTNGTFVNGARVIAKNFIKTDVIKIASSDLPTNWFQHKELRLNLFKDHKKTWIFLISILVILSGLVLYYFYGCKWLGCGCNLSAEQIYSENKNSIVRIVHTYYYKIDFKGRTYYVGKNKLFRVVEANPSKENLLPYSSVEGSGSFVRNDGTILTSFFIANPWLNKSENSVMLKEVMASKTIDHFTLAQDFTVCGESCELKWLANGLIDNQQNYIEAISEVNCDLCDTCYSTIQSVKRSIPENAKSMATNIDSEKEYQVDLKQGCYYSSAYILKSNSVLQDTFYFVNDTVSINRLMHGLDAKGLSQKNEGSIILNEKGELVGIIQQDRVNIINRNF